MKKKNFAVGSDVKVVKSNYDEGNPLVGHIGTVVDISDKDVDIVFDMDEEIFDGVWICDFDEIELVK